MRFRLAKCGCHDARVMHIRYLSGRCEGGGGQHPCSCLYFYNSVEVHVPWPHMHSIHDDPGVPNLSSQRQNPQLVALGNAIKRIRLENKISQEKLALRAELDRSYMGRVERGDNNVALLTLAKIAAALDVTLSHLLKEANL